jgi:uncharacterized protein (TIGR02246 family)
MKIAPLIFVCALLFALPTLSQTRKQQLADEKTGDALMDLYDRFVEASRVRDEATLKQIMTDDYTQVTASGRFRTKEIRIRDTVEDKGQALEVMVKEFTPRIYGNAAIAVCRVWEKYKGADGKISEMEVYSTVTFIKQRGKWRIAATHLTTANSN